MATEKELEEFIKMMDEKVDTGVGRIKVQTSNEHEAGTMEEVHHHGRCDVCSPYATGDTEELDSEDYVDNK